MSIHIPQAFLHGSVTGHGHGHNSNYLVNKYVSGAGHGHGHGHGSGSLSATEVKFKFNEDTSNYFYNQLSKILNSDTENTNTNENVNKINENVIISSSIDNTNNTDNFCLITKEKLEPNHITLICNHKFNYVPLYNEVVNQKNKQNNMYEITKLSSNQIKCPYCRVITNKLLPYIPYPSVRVVKNVNSYIITSYNSNPEYFLYAPKCCHERGNNTENKCQKYAVYYEKENLLLCPQHYKTHLLKQKTSNKKAEKSNPKGAGGSGSSGSGSGCCAILKSGKNIGKRCGILCVEGVEGVSQTNAESESKYCKKHYKIYCNT
jgi:hypothetical protein